MPSIILTLGDSVMDNTRAVDDDYTKPATELWAELRHLYMMPKKQSRLNVINRLKALVMDEKKEKWDKFLSRFMSIIYELGS